MNKLDFLSDVDQNTFEESLRDKDKWHKSFSSTSKFNLNSEVREKSALNKNVFKVNRIKNAKPQEFINNRLEGVQQLKKKTNEGGIGRGAALQRRMENIRPGISVHENLLRDYPLDNSGDLLSAPIEYQMERMIGDTYSDISFRRSLNDISRRGVASSDEEDSCSSGLERAFSEVSLSSTSASSASNFSDPPPHLSQAQDWILDEYCCDPSAPNYQTIFPSLK